MMRNENYKRTPEYRTNMSAAMKGRLITPEARAKISAAKKGVKPTLESRAKMAAAHRGIKLSLETRAKLSRSRKGVKNGNWKGGRSLAGPGYILVLRPDHPFASCHGYVMEHRLVMEAHIGRVLLSTEVVHHINGDIKDNRIENLMLFSSSGKHLNYHADERKKGGLRE
jgi:hypothetical protein